MQAAANAGNKNKKSVFFTLNILEKSIKTVNQRVQVFKAIKLRSRVKEYMKKALIVLAAAALFFGCLECPYCAPDCGGHGLGESWPAEDGCNTCACTEKGVACTEMACNSLCVDECGDGNCDEVVCLGEGCPCAETIESCPQDCS